MHRRRCAKHSRLPQSGCAEAMATEVETRNPQATSPLQGERLREALRLMLTIRFFDERALALYRAGEMRGTTHPYIGMEAVGVGEARRGPLSSSVVPVPGRRGGLT